MSDNWSKLKAELRPIIFSAPVIDIDIMRAASDGLKKLADDPQSDMQHLESVATDLIVTAIHAGAFCGPKWLLFRTRFADHPHIDAAAHFILETDPSLRKTIGKHGWLAAKLIANLIDSFAESASTPQPATSEEKSSSATSERNGVDLVTNDHIDEILQALLELRAFDPKSRKSTAIIARKAIGPHADPAMLKRYISLLKKRGDVGTKGGRTGGAWLTPKGHTAAEKINGDK